MLAVFRRELAAYFLSPIGYIFMGFFLLLVGLLFAVQNIFAGSPVYTQIFGTMVFLSNLTIPILTMRLFTEERRMRTDQLLLTVPLSLSGIVFGKYLAAVSVFVLTLLVTVLYPIALSFFTSFFGLAGWEIVGNYVGFFFLGCTFIAVGMFVSSLTENQVIAAVVTLGALLLTQLISFVLQFIPADLLAGVIFLGVLDLGIAALVYVATKGEKKLGNFLLSGAVFVIGALIVAGAYLIDNEIIDAIIIKMIAWLSLIDRFEPFGRGVLSLSSIVYYLSFVTLFVYLTVRMIEKKRWI